MRLHPRNNDDEIIALISQSAGALVTAAGLLARIISADRNDRAALREELHAVEHAADETHHRLIRLIKDTFVTPVDRDDLHRIGSLLDDCMDALDEAGDVVVLYQVGSLPPACTEQVQILLRCAELSAEALPGLRSPASLHEYWVEINSLENAADRLFRSATAELFATERDAIRLVKVKEVIERLETAADAFEDLANAVESLAMSEG
ncbi:DUF47 domain-containing protein [Actinomyces slackii]|uniref:Phosphate transport regulator (Distant homolog of PhoU) n=1 Tax=Actinomyces slackii TaxID=52774 RepID=A0A3S4UMZ5_9ACTO|nr:DUF47 family protein [Actinomyces slackii]VEG74304.1 Phosphate transport regulator (distant homolog of PhoU) [Actinomyces slackii]